MRVPSRTGRAIVIIFKKCTFYSSTKVNISPMLGAQLELLAGCLSGITLEQAANRKEVLAERAAKARKDGPPPMV